MDERQAEPTPGYHLVMCSFAGIRTASGVLSRLREEDRLEGVQIESEAVVWRDADGRIHVHEKDASGSGAVAGATAAGLVGLLTGPVALPLLMVVGAVAGGVAGHFMGQAMPSDDLREVAESLPPESSAFIALVDAPHADQLATAFREAGARVTDAEIHLGLSEAIRETVTHRIRRV